MNQSSKPAAALITGASSGIGATYADRLARRGHDLILVARDGKRLDALASRLNDQAGVKVETIAADLTVGSSLAMIERRLGGDEAIGLLVNSAGLGPAGPVLAADSEDLQKMIQLNVIALHRLTLAAASSFAARGAGAIINIASVVALIPERFNATYSATKAFVLALTQGLNSEVAPLGVRLQAVLPGLTRTEIFERAGADIGRFDPKMVMEVGEMVDAALAGFDQGELITIPSLPDAADWTALETARMNLGPNLSHDHAAQRYRA